MPAPKQIIELVERFERNLEEYKLGRYNEAQVRQEFINPFFEALGWDMNNRQGLAEAYKEVIHEDSIKVGMGTKAPDYCFRIGGTRKFFLEAKNPSVNIRDNIDPSYQIRRYAWSAKLPLSLLTDFEEFSVYDTRIKPKKNDKALTSRVLYFTFRDYIDKWDEIASIFSRDAIVKGSFDKYVESTKKKRGTAEVDEEFLDEIEKWRAELAKDIAKNNRKISQSNLNYSIQKIIDRIIFLRICEDRSIEDYGKLQALLNGTRAYQRLCEDFERADQKYNSGLFHFKTEKDIAENPDEITLKLKVSDDAVKSIIKNLYFPDSPYEFSVITADILGKVYEQFLGKVIRLTKGHRVVIEEKPEVRKAGGVYYTPVYIVDYIVKNTVGKLLEGKTPEQASKLKILDPACGSGSFLIGAYQLLLDWHLEWYINNNPKEWAMKKKPAVYQSTHGGWKLTITERKRILLNNIHGVDIDPQAVEVTKLSLLLKVLEGDVDPYLKQQLSMSFMTERALPDLGSNIKCGNSLIGPDFYEGKNLSLFGAEEMEKINTFDWCSKEKGFGEIMSKGGFDVVIGNPPYIRIQTLNEINPEQVEYFNEQYKEIVLGSYDIYILFLLKGFQLLRKNGVQGYILPHKFFQAEMGKKIRKFISNNEAVYQILDFTTNQVFENATTYTCLMFMSKSSNKTLLYKKFGLGENHRNLFSGNISKIQTDLLKEDIWNFSSNATRNVLAKIQNQRHKFADVTEKIFKGSSTGNDAVYLLKPIKGKSKTLTVFSEYLNKNIEIEKDVMVPFLFGESIRRYCNIACEYLLLFPYRPVKDKYELIPVDELKDKCPLTYNYLNQAKEILLKRKINMTDKDFYKYSAPRSLNEYKQRKIMIPDMLVKIRVSCDDKGSYFHGPAIHSIVLNEKLKIDCEPIFLGILNSRLFWFFISNTSTALRGNAYRLTPEFLAPFCFPALDDLLLKPKVKALAALAGQMLDVQNKCCSACAESDKKQYQQKIDILDKQIDALVYELYGLTEEEIRVVEGAG